MTRQSEIFQRQAAYCDGRSPLYADVCRRLAHESRVGALAPDLAWDYPLRLLGGLHYLALGGDAAWDDVGAALETHAGFLARWTAEQGVQTNEVQRSWGILPGFLSIADGRPLDLLELGPSAGLNLVWDRYRYRYATGSWGESAVLELTGDDRVSPPATLLGRRVEVVRRRGIDLSPIDATTDSGARVLQSFVWADQVTRLDRLQRAIEVLREDPPELIRGDYVEALPALLADRVEGSQLVVFQTASTMYVEAHGLRRLAELLRDASLDEPLVFLGTGQSPDGSGYGLDAQRLPGGVRIRLAVFDFHGDWLEWGA